MPIFQHPSSRTTFLGLFLWLSGAACWAPPHDAENSSATKSVIPSFPDQLLPYSACDGLALTHLEVIALLFSSNGESHLLRFARHQPSQVERRKLTGMPEGLQVVGADALLWTLSGSSGEIRLHGLASGEERVIFQGPVLSLGRPALAGNRIWWTTKGEGVVRVAYQETPWTGASKILRSPPVPTTAVQTRFAFSSRYAVLRTEKHDGVWLWKEDEKWRLIPVSKGHRIAGAFGDAVLAVDAGLQKILRLGLPPGPSSDWEPVYHTDSGYQIDPESLRPSPLTDAVDFVETSDDEARLVKLAPSGAWSKAPVAPDFVNEQSTRSWTWDGSWLAAVRRQESQLWLMTGTNERLADSMTVIPAREPPRASPRATAPPPEPPPYTSRQPAGEDPAAHALRWLESQLAAPFQRADGEIAVLIDSYEDDIRAGWVYDAAIATIAFTAAGKTAPARQLLLGLEILQEEEGSWIFSYDPDRARPLGTDRYTGSMAWVIMAANFYEWNTHDRSFAEMARRGLAYLERFRQSNQQQQHYGAISMGPANPQGFSTEHNLDCYSAFLWRGELDQEPRYRAVAVGIRRFILEVQWAPAADTGSGYFKVGFRDNEFYLDAQSWSVLALWDGDPSVTRRLRAALASAEDRLLSTSGRLGGETGILGFKEAEGVAISDKVWAEGTEGVVTALHVLGETRMADAYHAETKRYQTNGGGIPYATKNADGWPTAAAVASTAWFLLNALEPPRNPFQPGWKIGTDN